MTQFRTKKNIYIFAFIIFFIIIALYLNRSYAHIYKFISAANLPPVNLSEKYLFDTMATTSLTYVALGDSLTAGAGADNDQESFPYFLAQKIADNKKVILHNRAVPGYKTSDLIFNLLDKAINDRPDVISLLIGVNDIHDQVPEKEFAKNYEIILKRLTTKTQSKINVINLPYIGADNLILPPYNFYFNKKTQAYNLIIKNLADKYRVNYIDLYAPSLELFKKPGSHYSADLFHPSASGYKIWADLIYDHFNY